MKKIMKQLAVAALAAVSLATPSFAATTVGNATNGNCLPFGCQSLGARFTNQQLYSSAMFSGALNANEISFYSYAPGSSTDTIDGTTFNISLYYTSKTVTTLSGTDLASNRGALIADFGTFSLSGSFPDMLTFDGTMFNYDPTLGNLLMQVTLTGTNGTYGNYGGFLKSEDPSAGSRFASTNGLGVGDVRREGLVTTFNTAVPEPASWAMMIGGFGLVGGAMRRRRNPTVVAA